MILYTSQNSKHTLPDVKPVSRCVFDPPEVFGSVLDPEHDVLCGFQDLEVHLLSRLVLQTYWVTLQTGNDITTGKRLVLKHVWSLLRTSSIRSPGCRPSAPRAGLSSSRSSTKTPVRFPPQIFSPRSTWVFLSTTCLGSACFLPSLANHRADSAVKPIRAGGVFTSLAAREKEHVCYLTALRGLDVGVVCLEGGVMVPSSCSLSVSGVPGVEWELMDDSMRELTAWVDMY